MTSISKPIISTILFSVFFNYGVAISQEYARILESETTYDIISSKEVEITETYSIKINSKEGYKYAIYQDYIDKFRKVKSLKITIFNENGKKVQSLGKSDAHEFGMSSSYEIDDSKILYLDPKYRQYPFVLTVESKIKINGYISLPTWIPRPYFNLAVDESTLNIKSPESIDVNIRHENFNLDQKIVSDNNRNITFKVSNLEAINSKIRYKDFYKQQPKVLIVPQYFELESQPGNFNTWAEFGKWFYKLNNEPYQLSEKTKSFINKLDNSDTVDMINKIYNYMQDRTRYISIQLGIGGFKSLPTEDVENYGYGDCKALTTYMKNMLDYAKIPSNYILARAGRDVPEVIEDFPSNQFNHVYLGIPIQDTLYYECTSQTMPSNYTGQFTDDRNVLWISETNSSIIRSRKYSIDDNVRTSIAEVSIDKDGNAVIGIDVRNEGIFYDELMIYKSGNEDYIRLYNEKKFPYKDFSINNYALKQSPRDSATFKIKYNINVNGLGKVVGNRLILPTNVLSPVDNIIDENSLRKYAAIPRAITVHDSVIVQLPQNYWIYNIPEAVSIESKYGTYKVDIIQIDNMIIIDRKLRFHKGEYTEDEYSKFQIYFNDIKKTENKQLVLNSKT